jgi:hypothetical protein
MDALLLNATDKDPVQYSFVGSMLPDYPSCSPIRRMCSPRMKELLNQYLDQEDGPLWLPANAVSKTTGAEFPFFVLWFTTPTKFLWQPWYKKVLKSNILPPYILDRQLLGSRRVTSFDNAIWLIVHESVRDKLISGKLTDNIEFTRARVQ